jgi:uncharacterized protein involved in high-affinity Fe2+ transport
MMKVNRLVVAAVLTLGAVGAASAADAGLDFSPITQGVSVGTVALAIIAMGAIKIVPNIAKWGANKLANFF